MVGTGGSDVQLGKPFVLPALQLGASPGQSRSPLRFIVDEKNDGTGAEGPLRAERRACRIWILDKCRAFFSKGWLLPPVFLLFPLLLLK